MIESNSRKKISFEELKIYLKQGTAVRLMSGVLTVQAKVSRSNDLAIDFCDSTGFRVLILTKDSIADIEYDRIGSGFFLINFCNKIYGRLVIRLLGEIE